MFALLFGLALANASNVSLVVLDRPDQGYLTGSLDKQPIRSNTVPALLSALLGVPLSGDVSPELSSQVDQIVEPSVFHRPSAVLHLNIAGLDKGHSAVLMNSTRRTAVHEVNSNADSVVQGIDTVFPSFKDSVMHYPLDFNAMQGCDASCMERSLSEAMSHIGCEYRTASGAMDGTMRIATDKGVVELDLSNEADRTYAMELAALHKAVDDVVSETRTGAAAASRELPKYLDCTMMGMQLMRDTYGPDSDQFHAAHHALGGLTHCLMDDLWSCHGNRAYGQMTLLGDMSRGCGMGGGRGPTARGGRSPR
uniref:DUF7794 domain-containing protein n=1 Tax=Tetraselmis sp. GSL018 TaxID=582737 RepID=A0A061RZ47_9CHLO